MHYILLKYKQFIFINKTLNFAFCDVLISLCFISVPFQSAVFLDITISFSPSVFCIARKLLFSQTFHSFSFLVIIDFKSLVSSPSIVIFFVWPSSSVLISIFHTCLGHIYDSCASFWKRELCLGCWGSNYLTENDL